MICLENMRKIIKHCIYIYITFCLIQMWKFASLKNNTIVSSFTCKNQRCQKSSYKSFQWHSWNQTIPQEPVVIPKSSQRPCWSHWNPNLLGRKPQLQPLQVWSLVAIYKWYISGIYCQLGDYMPPTTFYGNQKQPLIWQWRNKNNNNIFIFHTTGQWLFLVPLKGGR